QPARQAPAAQRSGRRRRSGACEKKRKKTRGGRSTWWMFGPAQLLVFALQCSQRERAASGVALCFQPQQPVAQTAGKGGVAPVLLHPLGQTARRQVLMAAEAQAGQAAARAPQQAQPGVMLLALPQGPG